MFWLIITPPVKGHILDANEKRDFFENAAVPARMRRHGASRPDEFPAALEPQTEGGATWPVSDITGDESWPPPAGRPAPPPPSPAAPGQ